MLDDVRYAIRLLRKSPGTTAIAVFALALGLGGNAAMFSYVNVLILRPLPFPQLDNIVNLWDTPSKTRAQRDPVSPANFLDWRRQAHSFRYLAAYRWWQVNLTGVDDPERLQGYTVTPDFFPLLGLGPRLGRTFSNHEAEPGNDAVAVISYSFWKRRFSGSSDVIGRRISLDGRSFAVVGVMREDFDYPLATDVWAPLAFTAQERAERAARQLSVLGRLAPGVSLAQARAEMDAIAGRLENQFPESNQGRGVQAATLRDRINPVTDRFVMVLMAAAGFVLLLACANVANLNLARTVVRSRETAVRAALGASRWRLARQLLVESLIVSFAGAALSLAFSVWFMDAQRSSIPAFVYRVVAGLRYLRLDGTIVGFVLICALAVGLLCGAASAIQASSTRNLNERLREAGRGSAGPQRHALRKFLVGAEVALAMVLMAGAGLMVQTFRHLAAAADLGYNPKNLLTVRLALQESRYPGADQARSFYDELRRRLAAVPGVTAAALDGDWSGAAEVTLEGQPASQASEALPLVAPISPDYFRARGMPVLRGRPIGEQDGPAALPVAVLSPSVARRYWKAGVDPLGTRVRVGGPKSPWLTVVGVAGELKDWFQNQPTPLIYTAFAQDARRSSRVLLRTAGDPLGPAGAVRAQVRALDPNQPVYDLRSMEQQLEDQMSGVRIAAVTMSWFALFALLLAASGTYAVIAYSVSQRTHEIGVRIALGAHRREVLRLVVGQALKLAAIGLAVGVPAAYLLSRLMSSAVYGVVALDWKIFAGFALLIAASALAAGFFPARRAASVDPVTALRSE
jgi:putative ABC transport system permease protein